MATFDELVKEYWTLSASADDTPTTVGRFNKVKELLGEEGAKLATVQKYGGALRGGPFLVPRRGPKGRWCTAAGLLLGCRRPRGMIVG